MTDRVRALVDGYWWVEGPPSNRLVQRELIRRWALRHPDDELVLVVPQVHVAQVRADHDVPEGTAIVGAQLRPHGLAVMAEYRSIARRVGVQVAVTHNFVPWGFPSVVFVHDVLFQEHPEWFTLGERLYLKPISLMLGRADVVVTSSQHEASRIERLNRGVVHVGAIGIAPDPRLTEGPGERPRGLPDVDEFVLTVGRLNVRKNLSTTIAATLRSGAIGTRRPLVVVGERDGRGPVFSHEVHRAVEAGSVVFPGRVTDDELAWLYRHASLFVFLSLDEGFGLPPVEALAFGTPVVASDIAVFRETIGQHARLVDPLDVDSAAAAIAARLREPGGLTPVAPLSWDDAADALRAAVASVGGAGRAFR